MSAADPRLLTDDEEIDMRTTVSEDRTRDRTARVTGLLFLLSLAVPTVNATVVLGGLAVDQGPLAAARSVLASEGLFRIGIVGDLLAAVVAVLLAQGLYGLLRSESEGLALAALLLKLAEGFLIGVIGLGSLTALVLLRGTAPAAGPGSDAAQALVGQLVIGRTTLFAIPMAFLGVNFTIFLSLLSRSGLVPRPLAVFGVVSYVLIGLYAAVTILSPTLAGVGALQALCWAPSCLFELLAGGWLLVRGAGALPRPGGASALEAASGSRT